EGVRDGTDLADVGCRGGAGFRRIIDDRLDLLLGLVAERHERAVARLVRRDLRPGIPGPIGIVEETVAGLGLLIDAGQVKAPGGDLSAALSAGRSGHRSGLSLG